MFVVPFSGFVSAVGTSFDDAQVIGEGTYTGNITTNDYYYKVTVPGCKAILVTLISESDNWVCIQIYDSERQDVGLDGYASAGNGESGKAFYDGKSSTPYVAYIKVSPFFYYGYGGPYTLIVEFRPGDVMIGAKEISDNTTVSDEIKYPLEKHWYKISVPKGKLLNITYATQGGEITVTLYDSKGNYIDSSSGQIGYVSTEVFGETGTIYIEIETYEYPSNPIKYYFTPHLKSGVPTASAGVLALGTCCIVGIIIAVALIGVIIAFLIKKITQQPSKPEKNQNPPPPP